MTEEPAVEQAAALDPTETRPADDGPLYRLVDVERCYLKGASEVIALRGVSLEIDRGEFLSLEGPSGSGKSTLLHLLGALETPSSGAVIFAEHDLSRARDSVLTEIRRNRIGFVFQQFNLIPTLTALDNVVIAMTGPSDKEHRIARAADLLSRVGLEERLRHLPSRLSGGEQQRVAIARALANHPEVIIADEPTGNLDSENAREVMSLLGQLRSESDVTIIVATHDDEVARHASRRLRMRDGQIVTAPAMSPLAAAL
jgi:putative ABC transport system ATP-binding protein